MPERQAHAAHQTFQKSAAAADQLRGCPEAAGNHSNSGKRRVPLDVRPGNGEQGTFSSYASPDEILDTDSPEVVAQLEALDDAVFEAVEGKAAAMAKLHSLWPELKSRFGDALLAESCEQYIRYAISIWHKPAGRNGDHDPRRAVHAMEVLSVLLDEV